MGSTFVPGAGEPLQGEGCACEVASPLLEEERSLNDAPLLQEEGPPAPLPDGGEFTNLALGL